MLNKNIKKIFIKIKTTKKYTQWTSSEFSRYWTRMIPWSSRENASYRNWRLKWHSRRHLRNTVLFPCIKGNINKRQQQKRKQKKKNTVKMLIAFTAFIFIFVCLSVLQVCLQTCLSLQKPVITLHAKYSLFHLISSHLICFSLAISLYLSLSRCVYVCLSIWVYLSRDMQLLTCEENKAFVYTRTKESRYSAQRRPNDIQPFRKM